jgi:hypothetical protein
MRAIDRRSFLLAGAGLAVGGWVVRVRPAAAATAVLSPRRAATFRALVRSLHAAPDGRFRVLGAAAAQRRFSRWYAEQGAAARARANAVLDAVGDRPVPGYRQIARQVAGCRSTPEAARAAALAAAVDLVSLVCEPPPAEDERPATFALGLPA